MSALRHDSVLDDDQLDKQLRKHWLGTRTAANADKHKYAYITLLTQSTYLAGVVMLAHTLRKHGCKYALIVLYTPGLTQAAIRALELEAFASRIFIYPCELLIPGEHHKLNVAVERFADTWTKLRVFETFDLGYDTLCYLDADMTIHGNIDSVFDTAKVLPNTCIAAVHDCVCSPDKMPWTPDDHCQGNCAFNAPEYHQLLDSQQKENVKPKPTYQLFNSGMFLFHPHRTLWEVIMKFFETTDLLGTFKFPDQDFLTTFFRGRWMALPWQFNAVKTMAYRHVDLWKKEEIIVLHYIVDKPWAKRIGVDGKAGLKDLDGDTHGMWWDEYMAWFEQRSSAGKTEVTTIMAKHVARRDSELSDYERPDMAAIGNEVHGAKIEGQAL